MGKFEGMKPPKPKLETPIPKMPKIDIKKPKTNYVAYLDKENAPKAAKKAVEKRKTAANKAKEKLAKVGKKEAQGMDAGTEYQIKGSSKGKSEKQKKLFAELTDIKIKNDRLSKVKIAGADLTPEQIAGRGAQTKEKPKTKLAQKEKNTGNTEG